MNLNRYRLTAESLSPVMNCSRVRVKLEKINSETGVLDYAPGEKVTVALRVLDMPAQVVIKDAPDAELLNQQLLLEADKACEVFLIIQGSAGDKAASELYHPDGVKEVEPCRPKSRFPAPFCDPLHRVEPT